MIHSCDCQAVAGCWWGAPGLCGPLRRLLSYPLSMTASFSPRVNNVREMVGKLAVSFPTQPRKLHSVISAVSWSHHSAHSVEEGAPKDMN